ncbi:lipase [Planctomycetaceae bacterium SH139]
MHETPHVFGTYENLVGVYTPAEVTTVNDIGVIMLTPGMLHHVGPFGLHVELARGLAAQRIPSLRFCLSGIGESLAVGAAGESTQRAVDEVRQAMDFLQSTYGLRRFILFGLCSGADDSVNVALADERVIGTVLLDGCGYRTVGFYFRKYGTQLPRKIARRALRWGSRMRGWSSRVFWQASASHEDDFAAAPTSSTLPAGDDVREFPNRRQAERELQQLVDRGVEMLFLYTGGVGQYFNHRQQFSAMFPKLKTHGKIEVHYFEQLDHVVRLAEDRRFVVNQLVHWISRTGDRFASQLETHLTLKSAGKPSSMALSSEPDISHDGRLLVSLEPSRKP